MCRALRESKLERSLNLVRASPEHLTSVSQRRNRSLVRGTYMTGLKTIRITSFIFENAQERREE